MLEKIHYIPAVDEIASLIHDNTALFHAADLLVDSDISAKTALEVAEKIAEIEKIAEEKRKTATGPLYREFTAINDHVKRLMSPLSAVKDNLKTRLVQYQNYVRETERQAEIKRVQAATLPDSKIIDFTALMQSAPAKSEKIISTVKRWTFEVENINLIPRQFLTVDAAKITESIKKGTRKIPGIKIYQEEKGRL